MKTNKTEVHAKLYKHIKHVYEDAFQVNTKQKKTKLKIDPEWRDYVASVHKDFVRVSNAYSLFSSDIFEDKDISVFTDNLNKKELVRFIEGRITKDSTLLPPARGTLRHKVNEIYNDSNTIKTINAAVALEVLAGFSEVTI